MSDRETLPEPMSPNRWRAVSALFDRAVDLPPEARAALLDREASGDAALREEVERLLALDAGDPVGEALPPPQAGPWTLHERLGTGGMGEVWRASRPLADGLRQSGAVKLVRPGLGEDLHWRFRAERRILAGLDHPTIARLLDAGTAADGRPYLATELVRGEPITAHADRQRLTVNERLALFLEVCEAVAYAHARLVVHRDLKPGNVLVASGEGDGGPSAGGVGDSASGARGEHGANVQGARAPSPATHAARVKLLDFGIAKLLGAEDDGPTRTGRPVLTPAYAAPEQASGGAITTATDVYGLGVLLYELLAGRRPSAADLTRPSEAVTGAAPTGGRLPPEAGLPLGDETGALRSTTTERLRRRLRGDLDVIVLKALRDDPERRYASAAELAADIRRHLGGLPVEARPESAAYRVGKFVRRNRALVGVTAAALVAVLAASGAALWQAGEARAALAQAESDAAHAAAATRFMQEVITEGDARTDGVKDLQAARVVLDAATARL